MATTPEETAVTSPEDDTRATAVFDELQLVRRSSTAPPASRATALNCAVAPTSKTLSLGAPPIANVATGTPGSVGPLSQLAKASASTSGSVRSRLEIIGIKGGVL
jgi:hypothetical protein